MKNLKQNNLKKNKQKGTVEERGNRKWKVIGQAYVQDRTVKVKLHRRDGQRIEKRYEWIRKHDCGQLLLNIYRVSLMSQEVRGFCLGTHSLIYTKPLASVLLQPQCRKQPQPFYKYSTAAH